MHDYDILDLLVGIVAKAGRQKRKDLLAFGRCPSLCKLRDTLLYLARQRTQLSFPELGRYFGRHHTTIVGAVNNETKRLARNLRHASGQPLADWHKMILEQLDAAIAETLAVQQPVAAVESPPPSPPTSTPEPVKPTPVPDRYTPTPMPLPTPTPEPDQDA